MKELTCPKCGAEKGHLGFLLCGSRQTVIGFDQSDSCKDRETSKLRTSLEKAKDALIGLAMSRHTETGMYCFCDEWRGIGNAKKHSVECDRASAVLKEISDEKDSMEQTDTEAKGGIR